jgi:cation diffusion facilitator family transporter
MSHYRKPLALAVVLNAAISAGEATGGVYAGSLSLVMDAIHNLSDELALVFLLLALLIPRAPSRNLVRCANFMNSAGLLAVSVLIAWQAVERSVHATPVLGAFPTILGVAAAVGNWGVARLLREPSRQNAAMRLSYLHNLGDVYVSLAPVVAGLLVLFTGYAFLDPLVALVVAIWFIATTSQAVIGSRDELIWPERLVCDHPSNVGAP